MNGEKGCTPRCLLPHAFQVPVLPGLFLTPETNLIELLLYSIPCSCHTRYRSKQYICDSLFLCACYVPLTETDTQENTKSTR